MAIRFNPITGSLDLVSVSGSSTIEFAEKVAEIFSCPVSTAVGTLVTASRDDPDTVLPITTNVYDDLVFGAVIEKPTSTTAKVLITGRLSGSIYNLSGLTIGKPIFVGTSGELTTTPPPTGHLQKMGIATKSDTVYLLPTMDKVVRS